ncbi:extensin family protein [Jannaschia sp. W003]|uniref:extensin-like domain-containing protein n=1 Tax=Jannaschia sp. W003 TaxID=2867012 RepID=UPI0021A5C294|nr:extensin family protein [Jannaschia sp. W003]UWQ20429.1 extensin family protein [Jannaschia sp. W003]
MRAAALALLLAAALPAGAQETDLTNGGTAADPAENPIETSPAPEERPANVGAGTSAPAVVPEPEGAPDAVRPAGAGVRDALALGDADHAACLAALDALGAVFAEAEPIIEEGDPDCGILRPVQLEAVRPGVAFSPPAPLRCPAALALAEWTRDFAEPAAERLGRGAITAIDHGSTYVCRRRNNAPDGKPSEHSFGNAIDIMGFRFADGDPVAVQPRERDGTMAEAFQDAVRASGCLEFTTVLGPRTDEAHADHLHFDIVERQGGFRLCQ